MFAQHTITLTGQLHKVDLQLFTKAKFHLILEPADTKHPVASGTHWIIDFARNPGGTFIVPASWRSCTITVLYDEKNAVLVCENKPSPEAELRHKVNQAINRRTGGGTTLAVLGLLLPGDRLLVPAIPEAQPA